MSFVWKKNSDFVEYDIINEIRENIDSIDNNIACVSHLSSNYGPHRRSAEGTRQSSDESTDKFTDKDTDKSSLKSSEKTSHKSPHFNTYKSNYYPGRNSSKCIKD